MKISGSDNHSIEEIKVQEIRLVVAGLPPAKDGSKSIFNRNHGHHSRVIDLLYSVKEALGSAQWTPLESRHIGLELVVQTPDNFREDGLNLLGGVADVLQANRRGADLSHLPDLAQASLYYDDKQIQEARYSVESGGIAEYRVRVWVL